MLSPLPVSSTSKPQTCKPRSFYQTADGVLSDHTLGPWSQTTPQTELHKKRRHHNTTWLQRSSFLTFSATTTKPWPALKNFCTRKTQQTWASNLSIQSCVNANMSKWSHKMEHPNFSAKDPAPICSHIKRWLHHHGWEKKHEFSNVYAHLIIGYVFLCACENPYIACLYMYM